MNDLPTEAEAIVRKLADTSPTAASEYACFFCGAGDPVDRPIIHADDCLHQRATRWAERRWERDEGWRLDARQRLQAVQVRLRQGQPASRDKLRRLLDEVEASLDETEQMVDERARRLGMPSATWWRPDDDE